MSRTINRVTIMGNVGADPEIRYTADARALANFSVATQEASVRNKDAGARVDTEWHRIVAFGSLAEYVRDAVKKGKKVIIEGSLKTKRWRDKTTGQDRYMTEVWASWLIVDNSERDRIAADRHFSEPEKEEGEPY